MYARVRLCCGLVSAQLNSLCSCAHPALVLKAAVSQAGRSHILRQQLDGDAPGSANEVGELGVMERLAIPLGKVGMHDTPCTGCT